MSLAPGFSIGADILFDRGRVSDAGELAGVSHHTLAQYIQAREDGNP